MKAQTITIVGLERIGASIGLAIKQSLPGVTVVGHDRNAALARDAKEKVGAIDREEWNLPKAAAKADILVLATPIVESEAVLQVVGDGLQAHTLVLDLSSLKGPGLKWSEKYLRQGHYVGAVPVLASAWLADGRSDVETARPDLFKNSVFCLMPAPQADPQAVETAVNFGRLLGAIPYFLDPVEYDSLVQGVATVPGLMAAAIFSAIHNTSGWRDMLRFAGLPFALATLSLESSDDVVFQALNNKMATLRWLDALLKELNEVRRWIYEGESELLAAMLSELNAQRQRWLRDRAENDWAEVKTPDIERPTFSEQMLGGWISRRGKKDE